MTSLLKFKERPQQTATVHYDGCIVVLWACRPPKMKGLSKVTSSSEPSNSHLLARHKSTRTLQSLKGVYPTRRVCRPIYYVEQDKVARVARCDGTLRYHLINTLTQYLFLFAALEVGFVLLSWSLSVRYVPSLQPFCRSFGAG